MKNPPKFFLPIVAAVFCLVLVPSSYADDGKLLPVLSASKNVLSTLDDTIKIMSPDNDRDQLQEIQEKARRAPKGEQAGVIKKELPKFLSKRAPPQNKIDPATQNRTDNALADLANQVGDYPDAVQLSNAVSRRDPGNRDALNNLAAGHLGLGDYQSAIADATRNAKTHPDNETAFTIRALARYSSGDYLKAIEDAQRVLTLNPYNETALYTLKLAQNRLPSSTLSLNEQQKAQAEEIKREYQTLLQQQNQAEVLGREARTSLEAEAAAKIQENKPGEAVEAATNAVAADPRNARIYILRATAYNLLGQYAHAIEDAGAAIALNPRDPAAYDARSAALNQLGQHRDALADAFTAIALNPQDAYAYANRARAYERLRRFRAMVTDYQTAAALNPQFEPVYRDAVASFQRAVPIKEPSMQRPAPRPEETPTQRDSFREIWVTLISTLLGGTLISLGLLHVLSTRPRPATTTAIPAPPSIEAEIAASSGPIFFNNYHVLRPLGHGGMGLVYEAVDKALGRKVAIKKMRDELKEDTKEREHFLREARTVASLRHPSIVEIYTILESNNDLFLIFEYVPGRTLTHLLSEKKRLSIIETKNILRGVCDALEYAHQHGIVHRDLKPSNIMVTDEGTAKVMDFGIARQAKEALSRSAVTNTVVGTPQYMAPEAGHGIVRKESDLFSLGVCLYEMLTGSRPFPGTASTTTKAAMRFPDLSQVRTSIYPAVDVLITEALQPDPDRRIHSAQEFFERFESAV